MFREFSLTPITFFSFGLAIFQITNLAIAATVNMPANHHIFCCEGAKNIVAKTLNHKNIFKTLSDQMIVITHDLKG